MEPPELAKNDMFRQRLRKLFETIEQIFEAKQAVERKVGEANSPAYRSFIKYRGHFSSMKEPELHRKLFLGIYEKNKDAILTGNVTWLANLNPGVVVQITPALKVKGKKKPAVEINLSIFYNAADNLPTAFSAPLKETLCDNLNRCFYTLLLDTQGIIKAGELTEEQKSRKRELDILLTRCKPVQMNKPSMGVGNGQGLLGLISGLARQEDISRAFQNGDTRSLVNALASTVESIAHETGITDEKMDPKMVNDFGDRAVNFVDKIKAGGPIDIAGLTMETFGSLDLGKMMGDKPTETPAAAESTSGAVPNNLVNALGSMINAVGNSTTVSTPMPSSGTSTPAPVPPLATVTTPDAKPTP